MLEAPRIVSQRTVQLRISGLVQGVSYRVSAQDAARALGLAGWVRNLSSGDVEAMATGEADAIERFIAWCRRGPEEARVTGVEVSERAVEGFSGFQVRR